MNQLLIGRVRLSVVCVCSLFVVLLFAACGSIAGTGSAPATGTGSATITGSITGSIVSVNPANQSVTVSVNGQQFTINGLTDAQIAQLQASVGKTWAFQVTGSNGSYTISPGTSPQEQDNATPQANVPPQNNGNQGTGAPAQGSISFIGAVQAVTPSSLSVKMPNGDALALSITSLTDRGNFGTGLPSNGQLVKVDALTNADGSFTAKSLDVVKPDDQANPTKLNTVDVQGVTTSAVGSNGVINLKVGNKSYSFTMSPTTQVKGFVSAQAIGSGQAVKVTVLYTNGSPTLLQVKNGLD